MDLTSRYSDVAERKNELFVDVPEIDNRAADGEFPPHIIDNSGTSTRADNVMRNDGPNPDSRQPAADVSEPGPDYDEPACGAGQRDDAVPYSGDGSICFSSTESEIVPRTAEQGGDAADDDRGKAAHRAASANPLDR